MSSSLERRWYSTASPPLLLRPLSALYAVVAQARRRRAQPQQLPVPVIVVGNIAVGGTGKTPFTIWLIDRLRDWGWHPGLVSRGYGGKAPLYPFRVATDSDPRHAGDEPVMMQRRLLCPMYVGADRVAAARAVMAEAAVDIIVTDDGLQHYRLARQLEFCVLDGERRFGNGALLPAGPLRESPDRLKDVSLSIVNGGDWRPPGVPAIGMQLRPGRARSMAGNLSCALTDFAGQRVHAVAGIGNPPRFFNMLRTLGLEVVEHAFPDHHRFREADLRFGGETPVLMTEKDAVKCSAFATSRHWVVPVEAVIAPDERERVRKLVEHLKPSTHG